jgi:predicted aspartyl protease
MSVTKFSLPHRDSLIIVKAQLTGPTGTVELSLVLDTGCTQTAIRPGYLKAVGYDVEKEGRPLKVLTASKIEKAYEIKVTQITALDRVVKNCLITAQSLPPQFAIDGLIGLNFFKKTNGKLIIDFEKGEISL